MQQLRSAQSLIVKQKREWGEILMGFDYKNKYMVCDENGSEILAVREIGKNFFARFFLKQSRPFTIELVDATTGIMAFSIKRPFRFFFQECTILDPNGGTIANIKWRFAFFKKLFDVNDSNTSLMMNIEGPFFKPWTFNVLKNDMEIAKIVKKWSGFLKEAFTAEDNFGVQFNTTLSEKEKAVILGALIFFDFLYFERK